MKPKPTAFNMILVGTWNQGIIAPNWLGNNALPTAEQQVEISLPLMGKQRVMKFLTDRVEIALDGDRLQLSPLDPTESAMATTEGAAVKLLQVLRHTPIRACGLNYNFILNASTPRLDWLAQLEDHPQLLDVATPGTTTVQRTLTGLALDHGSPLTTLTLRSTDDATQGIDINFHYQDPSADSLSSRIQGAFCGCLQHVKRLLAIYDQELDLAAGEHNDDD